MGVYLTARVTFDWPQKKIDLDAKLVESELDPNFERAPTLPADTT